MNILFSSLSGALLATSISMLLWIFMTARWMLVKPSIVFALFFVSQIQVSAALFSNRIFMMLPDPWDFFFLAQFAPNAILILSWFTLNKPWRILYEICSDPPSESARFDAADIAFLSAYCVILIMYLATIPLMTTGLMSVFLDAENSAIAREKSLKLVTSSFVRYSYLFLLKVLAPYLAVSFFIAMKETKKQSKVIFALLTVLVSLGSILSGARSIIVMIVLTVWFAHYLDKHMNIRLGRITIAFVLVIAMPALMSAIREGGAMSVSRIAELSAGPILNRIFYMPMETGLWHVRYAQENGFFGIDGVRLLAPIFGRTYIDIPNLIYQEYAPWKLASGLSNTSFIFALYSRWGLMVLPLSVILALVLDLSGFILKLMQPRRIRIMVPVLAVLAIGFASMDYMSTLASGGFLSGLLFVLVVEFLISDRKIAYKDSPQAAIMRIRKFVKTAMAKKKDA